MRGPAGPAASPAGRAGPSSGGQNGPPAAAPAEAGPEAVAADGQGLKGAFGRLRGRAEAMCGGQRAAVVALAAASSAVAAL